MFASSDTLSLINLIALSISVKLKFSPPVTLNITPFALSILFSVNGFSIACYTASSTLASPDALPIPI